MAEPLLAEHVDAVTMSGEYDNDLSCLMAQTTRGHRVLLAALLAEIDLYPGQERVVNALAEHGPKSQNALAKILGIDVSTMTKSLQRLERSGFVSRSPCPTNRRISVVEITPAGDALRPEIRRVMREAHRRMTQGLGPEQIDVLSSLLATVRDNLCPEAATCRPT
ncbi:MarR family winged helix-turn-helix transcriptional regulator [Streptosporangium lutulentum]|uniref:DNA-binding MarR family transcriptional regulator n=1 Tax=Streptosporangium lutulentum TaxID=1461250 RepID=A0ABT9QJ01_9ACTN|nr:MarR family transcriptional regulator [Streptosporangium lutulentum]MDP9846737.1 DNA-binding MarR family transcriptional regulator [Streptosporangium lutulentum]